MEENINDYISDDNTYIGKLVHFWDTRGLPKKKINIILKDGITVTAYVIVPVLPPISQAEEGVFYILPDDSLNYVSNGHWRSIKPDGEDNTIEIIKDQDGNELPIDPNDKSVTLPVETTYTFEDIRSDGKRIGWRVRNNKIGSVVYSYPDIDTKSDGVHKTTTALSATLGAETSVLPVNIEGFDAEQVTLGETQLYDDLGTVAVVTNYDGTTVTAKTFTKVDYSDGVYRTTADLTQDIGQTTAVLTNQILNLDPSDIVLGETLIYDRLGTVATITAKAGVNLVATTITNTSFAESDGAYYTTAILPTTVNDTMVVNKNSIPEILDITKVVINETLIFDEDGTVAKLTEIVDESAGDMNFTTIASDQKNPPVFYTNDIELNKVIGQTTAVNRTDLLRIADKTTPATIKEIILNKTLVVDEFGTVGVVTVYAGSIATIETITITDGAPFVLKVENALNDTVGGTKAISLSNLKKFNNTAVDDSYKIIDKTLIFDTVRECIGLIVGINAGVATVKTIYSADAPYVFETTTFSLPMMGEVEEDIDLTTNKNKFNRLDNEDTHLEEYSIIPGKTTIYNRLEGRIAVIQSIDSDNGTFNLKTVYEGKSGNIVRLGGGYGRCPNKVDTQKTIRRDFLYANVSDMTVGKDIIFDVEGNLAYLQSYDAVNDTVTLYGIHNTYPQNHVLIGTHTHLNTTIGGTTVITSMDVQGSPLSYVDFRPYSHTVSDEMGTIGVVSARETVSGQEQFTVITYSTAGGDSGIYHITGLTLNIKPSLTATIDEATLRSSTDINWDTYASGKTLITDGYGTIASVSGPDDYDDYTLTTITSAARTIYDSSVSLIRQPGKVQSLTKWSLGNLDPNAFMPYTTKVKDSLGTTGVIQQYNSSSETYSVVTESVSPTTWELHNNYAQHAQMTNVRVGSTISVPVDAITRTIQYGAATANIYATTDSLYYYNDLIFGMGHTWMPISYLGTNVTIKLIARGANHRIVHISDLSSPESQQNFDNYSVGQVIDFTDTHTSVVDIVPGQTIYVDSNGSTAVVRNFDPADREHIKVRVMTKAGAFKHYFTDQAITDKVGDTTSVGISDIYSDRAHTSTPAIDSENDYVIGQTLVFDNYGRVGVVTGQTLDDYDELSSLTITTMADSVNWNRGYFTDSGLSSTFGGSIYLAWSRLTPISATQEERTRPKVGDLIFSTNSEDRRIGVVTAVDNADYEVYVKTVLTNMKGATASTIGESGFVPQPLVGDQEKFLRGDATWKFQNALKVSHNLTPASDTPKGWGNAYNAEYPWNGVNGDKKIFMGFYDTANKFTNQPSNLGELVTILSQFNTDNSYWLIQFWYYPAGDDSGLKMRYGVNSGSQNEWRYPDNSGEFGELGGAGAQVWRTSDIIGVAQDSTSSISKNTLTDPTSRKTYDKAKIGDLVIDGEARMAQITALSSSTVAVKTLQFFMTGATASTAGKGGLVPKPAAGDQNKALSGDSTWKEYTRHEDVTPGTDISLDLVMQGATASADGLEGFVPKPEAGDNEKFLRGDGEWETPTFTPEEITTVNWGWDTTKVNNVTNAYNIILKIAPHLYYVSQDFQAKTAFSANTEVRIGSGFTINGESVVGSATPCLYRSTTSVVGLTYNGTYWFINPTVALASNTSSLRMVGIFRTL